MTVRLLTGDCRSVLRSLPDQSVHCCVTSPPYWGLRSYLPDNHPDKHLEIGSEPTVHDWVRTIVDVFREVRRVLRDDGTLWLNLGDSYAGSRCGGSDWPGSTLNGKQTDHSREAKRHQVFTDDHKNASAAARRAMTSSRRRDNHEIPRSDIRMPGFKPKDLIGQPWRVAFALQEDGWYLRSDIIWNKRNPMPESVRDRPTKAHEYIFLLSKSEHYFYDHEAIKEDSSPDTHARYARGRSDAHKWAGEALNGNQQTIARSFAHMVKPNNGVGFGHGYDKAPKPRSVRTPEATREEGGAYADGASDRMGRAPGWRKAGQNAEGAKNNASFDAAMVAMPQRRNKRSVWTLSTEGFKGAHFATFPTELVKPCILAGCPIGGTVLDPFGGSGTVGLVCDRTHRDAVLIDLDERNHPMATKRITAETPLFAEIA